MILKKYKINFFVISILIFYLMLLIKINILFAYNKIVYNFNYPTDLYTLKKSIDINYFYKKKINIEGSQYGYGSSLYKVYQPNISPNIEKTEFTNLYKKSEFFKKNLIVQNELLKEFNFSFEVKNLNLNFLVLYFINIFLIFFTFFIFLKWIFYFSNRHK
jgi:hypothetical protein